MDGSCGCLGAWGFAFRGTPTPSYPKSKASQPSRKRNMAHRKVAWAAASPVLFNVGLVDEVGLGLGVRDTL